MWRFILPFATASVFLFNRVVHAEVIASRVLIDGITYEEFECDKFGRAIGSDGQAVDGMNDDKTDFVTSTASAEDVVVVVTYVDPPNKQKAGDVQAEFYSSQSAAAAVASAKADDASSLAAASSKAADEAA